MAELPSEPTGWLSENALEQVRGELPLLYVNAIPVRLGPMGELTEVGLLLRADDGAISRAIVAGRVLYHESIREALMRNLEKDLGSVALPRIPITPVPFAVAEYFPTPGSGPFTDSRQHAVALAYVVAVDGDCEPSQNSLDIVWLSPEEAASEEVGRAMTGGQDTLLRQALAHCGVLP